MSATKERIEAVAAVILDKWQNGDGSQVGGPEDWDMTDEDFTAAMKTARQEWEQYIKPPRDDNREMSKR